MEKTLYRFIRIGAKLWLTNSEQARPQLKSYIFRITAGMEDTEDIVQDTFIKASEKIGGSIFPLFAKMILPFDQSFEQYLQGQFEHFQHVLFF